MSLEVERVVQQAHHAWKLSVVHRHIMSLEVVCCAEGMTCP
jgi:hypothetical protein